MSTLASYTDQVHLHITPALGRIPLEQLGPREIRLWLAAKQQQTSARGRHGGRHVRRHNQCETQSNG